jgi:hypothetical protein
MKLWWIAPALLAAAVAQGAWGFPLDCVLLLTILSARRFLVPGGTLCGLVGGLLLGAVRGVGSGPLSALYVILGWLAGAWFERIGRGPSLLLLGAGLTSLVVAGEALLSLTLGHPVELGSAWRLVLIQAALTWLVAR